jgi:tetratricopeptide (TPR) repeat protein
MMDRIIARGVGASFAAAFLSVTAIAKAQAAVSPAEPPTDAALRTEERARALFESGQAHYERGEYQAAVGVFREAQRLWPSPELLYNLAQAERLSGDCRAALEHYREFAAAGKEAPADLQEKIGEMEQCSAAAAARAPNQAPAAITAEPAAPARQEPKRSSDAEDSAGTFRVLGWASLGGAALSAALGTVFALQANASKSELEEANQKGARWNAHYESVEESMVRDRSLAIGFFVGAGVLAGTGAWLLLSPPTGANGDGVAAKVGWKF